MEHIIFVSLLSLLLSSGARTRPISFQDIPTNDFDGSGFVETRAAGHEDHSNVISTVEDAAVQMLGDGEDPPETNEDVEEVHDTYTLELTQSDPSSPRNESYQFCPHTCGGSANVAPESSEGFVPVEEGEMPWMASVVRVLWLLTGNNTNEERQYQKITCPATILNSKNVLVSASCIETPRDWNLREFYVIIDDPRSSNSDTTSHQQLPVEEVGIHKRYYDLADQPEMSNPLAKYNFDIAVVHLRKDIRFGQRVAPVCLAPLMEYTNILVTSVGYVDYDDSGDFELCKTSAVVLDFADCYEKSGVHMLQMTICAESKQMDKKEGFTGGPLMVNIGGVSYQVGVASTPHLTLQSRNGEDYSNLHVHVNVPFYLPFLQAAASGGQCV